MGDPRHRAKHQREDQRCQERTPGELGHRARLQGMLGALDAVADVQVRWMAAPGAGGGEALTGCPDPFGKGPALLDQTGLEIGRTPVFEARQQVAGTAVHHMPAMRRARTRRHAGEEVQRTGQTALRHASTLPARALKVCGRGRTDLFGRELDFLHAARPRDALQGDAMLAHTQQRRHVLQAIQAWRQALVDVAGTVAPRVSTVADVNRGSLRKRCGHWGFAGFKHAVDLHSLAFLPVARRVGVGRLGAMAAQGLHASAQQAQQTAQCQRRGQGQQHGQGPIEGRSAWQRGQPLQPFAFQQQQDGNADNPAQTAHSGAHRRSPLGRAWYGLGGPRPPGLQYRRTAESKCQVRRISMTSYSPANAGEKA